MIYWIGFLTVKILNWIYFPTTYINLKKLPRGSFILASNHLSNLDPFILGTSRWRHFSFVAKDSLFKNRFLAFIFREFGAIPIKRDTSDFRAIREVLRRVKKGHPLVVFPEGTRGAGDRTKKIQAGVGLIALKAGVPVVPAFIEGSNKVLPPGGRWFRRHPVTIVFGEPIHFSKDASYSDVAQMIMTAVYTLSDKKLAVQK